MPQFQFLDQLKNSLISDFNPEQGQANPNTPPGMGQAAPPQLPGGQGSSMMGDYMPPPQQAQMPPPPGVPEGLGGGGASQGMGGGGGIGGLGQITIQDLLGLGLNALLVGLLHQNNPMQVPPAQAAAPMGPAPAPGGLGAGAPPMDMAPPPSAGGMPGGF